jgi:4-hydroxy-tetrahydrodipicolinate synthase
MPASSDLTARIRGSIPALITPFRDGALDEMAFAALVERQIADGSHGLVPCGTTGESATLTEAEHERAIRIAVEISRGRAPVIAGAGSNNTAHAIHLAQLAKRVGADAVLVVTPYYSKPSQEGVFQHFKAINDAVDIPIVVYNVPARTVTDISVETMARIASLPNVIASKDASGALDRVTLHRTLAGSDFIQLCGNDDEALGFNAHGGKGCISVTANVAPKLCAEMQEATLRGDFERARAIDDKLAPLHKALFCEPSPAPAKYACSLLGLCSEDVRLPLVRCTDAAKARVRDAVVYAGLL